MHDLLSEDKVKDILFKLEMLGFETEYDEKKDNLKSYLKGRRMHSRTYWRYQSRAGDIKNNNNSKLLNLADDFIFPLIRFNYYLG
jgi:hypothetical protein